MLRHKKATYYFAPHCFYGAEAIDYSDKELVVQKIALTSVTS